MKKKGCNCAPESPFCWHRQRRPSIFFEDPHFRAVGAGKKSKSQRATERNERDVREGRINSTILGISRNRDAELLRLRDYTVYSRARRKDVKVEANGNVAA